METKSKTSKGVLLARYFDRRAVSSISQVPNFKLTSVQFGYGYLDTSTDPAKIKPIPLTATKADITNVYIDNRPSFTYDENTHQIKVRTEIPAGAETIPEAGANVNVACILDDMGEAVAMLVGQLTVVNRDRGYLVTGTIETNLN
ncbi:TPA: hypothetical protein QDZ84_002908 [Shewanella algae]|uniref:hypothetical protein n=1 Tax=Shewanella algae TaxID=38313 RepID=UPI001C55FEEA|nr:hypothetical protein [Shewanella algae]HDS1207881.1 hypothetical protein [Shewanella algae]